MLSPLTGFACSKPWRQHLQLSRLRPPVQDQADIQRTIESLAREPEGGLILPSDTFVENPSVRKFIVGLTALHRLPALYTNPEFVRDGGLMSYGIDQLDQYRGAASYVNRILKGEAPADLPVQHAEREHLFSCPRTFLLTCTLRLAWV
jgi:putative ABC transport system substrate-binding protein